MRSMSATRQGGFTLVEMLVVAPIVILLVGILIGYLTTLTGRSLRISTRNEITYSTQDALNTIEDSALRATSMIYMADANSSNLVSPQGSGTTTVSGKIVNNSDGTAWCYNSGASPCSTASSSSIPTVLMTVAPATSDNSANVNRQIVYLNTTGCGANMTQAPNLMVTTIFFVSTDPTTNINSLWKRTIIGAGNPCGTVYQRASCTPGWTNSNCKVDDEKVLDYVSGFTVSYFPNPGSTTALTSAQITSDTSSARVIPANTILVTLTTTKPISGSSVTYTAQLRATSVNIANH